MHLGFGELRFYLLVTRLVELVFNLVGFLHLWSSVGSVGHTSLEIANFSSSGTFFKMAPLEGVEEELYFVGNWFQTI